MGKNKHSVWAQEVQFEEATDELNGVVPKNLLKDAHEALNRFCQKEQKRGKNSKRRRHCWQ